MLSAFTNVAAAAELLLAARAVEHTDDGGDVEALAGAFRAARRTL